MRLQITSRRLAGLAVVALAAIAPTSAFAHGGGTVYTESNAAANAVQAFDQAPDGTLTPGDSTLTGGAGSGAAGLGSQGALALERDWLVAVNAGSNDVSLFRIRHGRLVLVDRVPSGGTTPNSVTIHDGVVYVLNAGGSGNISGFRLGHRGLWPLAGSTQPLASATAGAVQVSFTPRGDQLVVSEKGANTIETFPVDRRGRASAGTAHASAGAAPFGFSFGKHDALNVTEAGASALTSYALDPVRPDHRLARERPGRGLLGRLHEQRPLHVHGRRGDGRDLGLRPGVGRHALARHARAAPRRSWRRAPIRSTRRSRTTATSTSTAATRGQISAFRIGWNGSLTPLGAFGALPAGFGGLVVGG